MRPFWRLLVGLLLVGCEATHTVPVAVELDAVPSSDWLVVWVTETRTTVLGERLFSREPRLCQDEQGKLHCHPLCGKGSDLTCIFEPRKECPIDSDPMGRTKAADPKCLEESRKTRSVLLGVRLMETPNGAAKSLSVIERRGAEDKSEGVWLRVCSLLAAQASACIDSVLASSVGEDRVHDPAWFIANGKLDRVTLAYIQTRPDGASYQHAFECTAGEDNRAVCEHLTLLEKAGGFTDESSAEPSSASASARPLATPDQPAPAPAAPAPSAGESKADLPGGAAPAPVPTTEPAAPTEPPKSP